MVRCITAILARLRQDRVASRVGSNPLATFLFGALAFGHLTADCQAQENYPARPITVIVPFAAGGPTDIVARIVKSRMSRNLGQPVLVENVVGAGGTTATIRAMRSPVLLQ